MVGPGVVLALLRLWIALSSGAHGLSHLLDLKHFESTMIREGLHPARFWAAVSSSFQLVGAVMLALGFAVPLGTAAVGAGMWMAFLIHRNRGFWVHKRGYEYPLCLFIFSGVVAAAGAGRFSLDAVLGLQHLYAHPAAALTPFAVTWLGATVAWVTRDRSAAAAAAHAEH